MRCDSIHLQLINNSLHLLLMRCDSNHLQFIRIKLHQSLQGVFDGVTGIVRKPVEGAKQEGVAGFFKGKLCLPYPEVCCS